jgi:elongation factor P--beta-lysine ligase
MEDRIPTWKLLKRNPNLFQRYFVKEYLIQACREFFLNRKYHELESPIMTPALPQERYMNPLSTNVTFGNGTTKKLYITPTTETFNKKILAAGLGEHFVITKVARGLEQIGHNHNPEFTMLEWYHLDADYRDIMSDCEELFRFIKKHLDSKFKDTLPHPDYVFGDKIFYNGEVIDISEGWDRVSVPEALETLGIKLEDIQDITEFRKIARDKGYNVSDTDDWQIVFELIFATEIESKFNKNKPTFVYNYPKIMCPLTQANKDNPLVCEKVELYIAGKELGNGYTELRDWEEQYKRFREEETARADAGLEPIEFDHDLIDALKEGLPNVAGIGVGLDRIAMLFANAKYISEINYFPGSDWDIEPAKHTVN